ncbi:unnamed protein product, partial [Rotaria sp. Silwood1]
NEDMENETLQRRSTATIQNMGINSYSTFDDQSDLTNDKLPVLQQNTHCITQEQRISDLKHTFYNEQLSSSNTTMNWDMESNYICPSVVHHSSNNNYIHLSECILQTNPSTTIIQNPQTIKLNNDDEIQQDNINNTTQQSSLITKQNFTNFTNTDLNGSKVIRLVRAKQATKRKSSLDTLIEVVQKELLRVNGQTNSTSPPSSPPPSTSHYSQTRSSTSSKQSQQQHRTIISSVLPSSHPSSLTSQSNHSFKIARKRTNHHLNNNNNTKRIPLNRHRNKSFNNNNDNFTDDMDFMDNNEQQQQLNESIEDDNNNQQSSSSENVEEIVRDTVDKLVAITLLNNAPFIVNMITGTSGNNTTNINNESKPLTNIVNTNTTSTIKPITTSSDYYRNDLALLSTTASELRNSMQQISPIKQPTTTISTEQIKPSTSTLFVTPSRILNLQTVIPKPTTNIQIGNTKIILVSSSTNLPSPSSQQQQQTLVNNSPVKLVKLTSTLPKNVQIVIPSRTTNESLSTTIHPLTTCSIDQIPQAAQEVTITTSSSSNINKLRRRSSSTTPTDKPVGKILRPIAKVLPVYSSNNSNHVTSPSSTLITNSKHDEITKPMAINFQQRSTSTHGPMIYRMTSVNSNVPVFRVHATTTTPTTSTINTDSKPISVATTTNMCYESKQTHNTTTTTGGSVSVLACFKTTKKRNKVCQCIADEEQLLSIFVKKLFTNLQYSIITDKLIERTVGCFSDLTHGYQSVRKLVKLDPIQYFINNHTQDLFPFLHPTSTMNHSHNSNLSLSSWSRLRTTFYSSVGRMLMYEFHYDDDDDERIEAFMTPFTNHCTRLVQIFKEFPDFSLLNPGQFSAMTQFNPKLASLDEIQSLIIGISRDLRGLCSSLVSKQAYTSFFDWLYPSYLPLFLKALYVFYDRKDVYNPLLKFFYELTSNRQERLIFDSTKPSAYLLFRETSNLLYIFQTKTLLHVNTTIPESDGDLFYKSKLKPIITSLKILQTCLMGNYVNFGVFQLYSDPCFDNFLQVFISILTTIKISHLFSYPKLTLAFFSLIETFSTVKIDYLANLSRPLFGYILETINEGLLSSEQIVQNACCVYLDTLLSHVFRSVKKHIASANLMTNIQEYESLFRQILVNLLNSIIYSECKNIYTVSKPLLGLILLNENKFFTEIKQQLLYGHTQAKQAILSTALDNLMTGIDRTLKESNKENFTQNITQFRSNVQDALNVNTIILSSIPVSSSSSSSSNVSTNVPVTIAISNSIPSSSMTAPVEELMTL